MVMGFLECFLKGQKKSTRSSLCRMEFLFKCSKSYVQIAETHQLFGVKEFEVVDIFFPDNLTE